MSLVERLVKNYDGFSIEIPRWEIPDSGVTALWGPSGSGKTSVFRLLIGLEPCPGLSWKFDGVDLAQLPVPARRLGVLFQSLELFPHMTAEENIWFAAEARLDSARFDRDVARARLKELTEDLRMSGYLGRKAHLLSGGEAQRVALARAVIAQPRFLFLDEPFSSLDAELKMDARGVVKRVIDKFKIPTLLITHDRDDLMALAQNVVKIKDGRLAGVLVR